MEQQKRFITDASHELKTPITSIATSADIAAMEHEGDEWIANIQKQTMRLARLVNDLVALSRLDEETPFPEKCGFSLSDAVWEAAEPFAVLAKAEGKRYKQRIEEGLVMYGNRDSIQQMVSILLDNAIKYSGKEERSAWMFTAGAKDVHRGMEYLLSVGYLRLGQIIRSFLPSG